jgi:hypothetical protein
MNSAVNLNPCNVTTLSPQAPLTQRGRGGSWFGKCCRSLSSHGEVGRRVKGFDNIRVSIRKSTKLYQVRCQ